MYEVTQSRGALLAAVLPLEHRIVAKSDGVPLEALLRIERNALEIVRHVVPLQPSIVIARDEVLVPVEPIEIGRGIYALPNQIPPRYTPRRPDAPWHSNSQSKPRPSARLSQMDDHTI